MEGQERGHKQTQRRQHQQDLLPLLPLLLHQKHHSVCLW